MLQVFWPAAHVEVSALALQGKNVDRFNEKKVCSLSSSRRKTKMSQSTSTVLMSPYSYFSLFFKHVLQYWTKKPRQACSKNLKDFGFEFSCGHSEKANSEDTNTHVLCVVPRIPQCVYLRPAWRRRKIQTEVKTNKGYEAHGMFRFNTVGGEKCFLKFASNICG